MSQQPATIETISVVAPHTSEIVFKTSVPFLFIAGQYVTVTLPTLKALPLKEQFRDFSIASAPEDTGHIAIALRDSESPFKKELLRGDKTMRVLLDGPKGVFLLPEDATIPIVCIAGGIGITPFLSIIRHIAAVKAPIRLTLFYYNRNRESAPYLAELEGYGASIKLISIFGMMQEREIAEYLRTHPQKNLWYLAGPRGLVKTAREILTKLRVDERHIKSEEFSGYE